MGRLWERHFPIPLPNLRTRRMEDLLGGKKVSGNVDKEFIREGIISLGFEAVGFTTVEPFELYKKEVMERSSMYSWIQTEGFSTLRGANPLRKHPWSRSIMVVVRNYHKRAFPRELLGRFGRCYMVDERKIHGIEYRRFKDLLAFLSARGIRAHYDEEVPARMAASRAGVATYGKNCFAFARNCMEGSSWLEIVPIVTDLDVEPDEPTFEVSCPEECHLACLKACPTGALYEPLKMNPFRCIAYLTYYGPELTPRDMREAMGTWVYGCDRCQEVCPRNRGWGRRSLEMDPSLERRASDWDLVKLLTMDETYYLEKVWPQFFYISRKGVNRWQMNAARALGNLGDRGNVPHLARGLRESPHENVRAMCAWALGKLGGERAKEALEKAREDPSPLVREEVRLALGEI
jgi:epoxyqueuosine reductase